MSVTLRILAVKPAVSVGGSGMEAARVRLEAKADWNHAWTIAKVKLPLG